MIKPVDAIIAHREDHGLHHHAHGVQQFYAESGICISATPGDKASTDNSDNFSLAIGFSQSTNATRLPRYLSGAPAQNDGSARISHQSFLFDGSCI